MSNTPHNDHAQSQLPAPQEGVADHLPPEPSAAVSAGGEPPDSSDPQLGETETLDDLLRHAEAGVTRGLKLRGRTGSPGAYRCRGCKAEYASVAAAWFTPHSHAMCPVARGMRGVDLLRRRLLHAGLLSSKADADVERLERYRTVGQIMEEHFGVKGAKDDPALAYLRDPYYFQQQTLLANAEANGLSTDFRPPTEAERRRLAFDDALVEARQVRARWVGEVETVRAVRTGSFAFLSVAAAALAGAIPMLPRSPGGAAAAAIFAIGVLACFVGDRALAAASRSVTAKIGLATDLFDRDLRRAAVYQPDEDLAKSHSLLSSAVSTYAASCRRAMSGASEGGDE